MNILMRRKINRIISLLLAGILLTGVLGGCAKESESIDNEITDEEIELVEPVGASSEYEEVVRRNIYDSKVYSSVITPRVTEYLYTADESFGSYGKLPGEAIAKGEVLIYGDVESIDEEIENLSEDITQKAENYIDELTNLSEDLYDAKKNEYKLSCIVQEKDNAKPDENSFSYNLWSQQFMSADSSYKSAVLSREKIEENLKEKEELYDLEKDYDLGRLSRLQEKKGNAFINADEDGVVVASAFLTPGDGVGKNTEVIATGNVNEKVFLTDYINQGIINKTEDIYAVVNGKRYEVTYVARSKEEYARLVKKNGSVYTEFIVDDPMNEIKMSDFGDIVLVNAAARDVLSISVSALVKEGSDYFVYRFNGTDTDYVPVTVGVRDNVYAEILTGLSEGDQILSTEAPATGLKTVKLEKGSVSTDYSDMGYLYYPQSIWLVNPVKQGTVYLKELSVKKYEKVSKGQVLATLEVIGDEVAIKRIERKILRHQERLVRLMEKKSKHYSDEPDRSLDRAIKEREKAIEDLTKQLSKLKEYNGTFNIISPCDGIITDVPELKEGELLNTKQKIVQVADETQGYIIVEDSEGRLSYGTEINIVYKSYDGTKTEAVGTVATIAQYALSKGLQSGYALISIKPEDIVNMASAGSIQDSNGYWNRSRFNVETTLRKMDNVVLVPRAAVKDKNGDTYVKVKKDGRVYYTGFIAGGSDKSYYWVVDGLSEGMEICLE